MSIQPPVLTAHPSTLIVTHTRMKTTIELPNDLLLQAKAMAVKRQTTLKSMIEHALRRELHEGRPLPDEEKIYTYNEYGFPVLKRGVGQKPMITNDMISKILEDTEDTR